jgi:hypothetical protein
VSSELEGEKFLLLNPDEWQYGTQGGGESVMKRNT